jgi:hypothetical protein
LVEAGALLAHQLLDLPFPPALRPEMLAETFGAAPAARREIPAPLRWKIRAFP